MKKLGLLCALALFATDSNSAESNFARDSNAAAHNTAVKYPRYVFEKAIWRIVEENPYNCRGVTETLNKYPDVCIHSILGGPHPDPKLFDAFLKGLRTYTLPGLDEAPDFFPTLTLQALLDAGANPTRYTRTQKPVTLPRSTEQSLRPTEWVENPSLERALQQLIEAAAAAKDEAAEKKWQEGLNVVETWKDKQKRAGEALLRATVYQYQSMRPSASDEPASDNAIPGLV